ncbi:Mrp/NBP35 family ATP-binding protein [Calorimonas adulescens]|uniref:Iron-sulfur cluster carrier protein n=1 Tax=Calorimonas adulescens TaxID=2606906 RepID=A0A5D8Q9M1_9THEO|nr:Mrp/NBP35 family ATP-binding protein [Calorimonas adulescens]TZE81211.1 Mrp/NBP35 family ATP-binding protein [Calorimonas adulescens]
MDKQKILDALRDVYDPELGRSIVELGMVKPESIDIDGSTVKIRVNLTIKGCPLQATIKDDIEKKILSLGVFDKVVVTFGEMSKEEKDALMGENTHEDSVFDTARTILVGSGKGGVGKSTIAVNLAIAASKLGHKVGLIDADILGFSISRMLGINDIRPNAIDETHMFPIRVHDIEAISMGNFVSEDSAVIWRGPLLSNILQQFMYNVQWGDIDYMFVDLPPGTGDVPLSIMQLIPQSYLLLTTTPQSAASHVAGRLGKMAQKVGVDILGVVENMSYFECPDCGSRHYIFGEKESEKLAKELKTMVLGEIPIITDIREKSDTGKPIALEDSNPVAEIYKEVFRNIDRRCTEIDESYASVKR